MANEQDPMPKIQASREDIEQRQRQLQQRRLAAQRAARAKQGAAAGQGAPVAAQASGTSQTVAVAALVIAVLLGAFATYLFLQLQEANSQLRKTEAILNDHAKNLAELNDKLSASDENANLSVGALKVILKENAGEIRKLWDLSNKSNKPKIVKNQKSIDSLEKKLVTVTKNVGGAGKGVAANKKEITSLKASQAKQKKSLESEMAKLKASAGALPAETELRIAANEESIRSINAARKKQGGNLAPGSEGRLSEMQLEIEDIQIRLDRMQNAIGGAL